MLAQDCWASGMMHLLQMRSKYFDKRLCASKIIRRVLIVWLLFSIVSWGIDESVINGGAIM